MLWHSGMKVTLNHNSHCAQSFRTWSSILERTINQRKKLIGCCWFKILSTNSKRSVVTSPSHWCGYFESVHLAKDFGNCIRTRCEVSATPLWSTLEGVTMTTMMKRTITTIQRPMGQRAWWTRKLLCTKKQWGKMKAANICNQGYEAVWKSVEEQHWRRELE